MPLQNRVLPTGDVVSIPQRGTFTGNRGIIHQQGRVLSHRRWSHHAWICCSLNWQGRRRDVMTGRKWTELFFLDEAVALAAGHRPCGYCRRSAYSNFKTAWEKAFQNKTSAKEMDRIVHAKRVDPYSRRQQRYRESCETLPAGCFVLEGGTPWLLRKYDMLPYDPEGYGIAKNRTKSLVTVLTPEPFVRVLAAGYKPILHKTAQS